MRSVSDTLLALLRQDNRFTLKFLLPQLQARFFCSTTKERFRSCECGIQNSSICHSYNEIADVRLQNI